jgi:putative transposase
MIVLEAWQGLIPRKGIIDLSLNFDLPPMARLPRLSIPGQTHWVSARGNNGQSVFITEQDQQQFVSLMADLSKRCGVAVHAYVLLANQFQLLLTPATQEALPAFMQALGRTYVSGFNRSHARTGTLWEGRYRSTVVQGERHLIDCMVWMDTAPVRALLCAQAQDYAWSSCRHHVGVQTQSFITPHPQIWELGNTPFAREAAYAQRLQTGLTQAVLTQLQEQCAQGWVLGDTGFVAELQKLTTRRLSKGRPGRPVKRAL